MSRPGSLAPPAVAAGLCLLALAVRALPWRRVFIDGQVMFTGNDAYYHARRVLYSASQFPSLLQRDPYLNFPHGGEPIWAPLLDLAAALGVRVLGAAAQPEPFLSWIPPVLGAVTVGLVYCAARAHFGGAVAAVAAGLLAVLPAHTGYSRIGFFDHHAAVALVTAALLALSLAWVRRRAEPGLSLARDGALAASAGALLGGALLVWPGMILQVGIANTLLGLALLARSERAHARRQAWMLAGTQLVAALVVAPASLGRSWEIWGSFTPVVLTSFQPLLFLVGAVAFASYAIGCAGSGPLDFRDRAFRALAGAGVGTIVSLLWLPELADGLGDAVRWLTRDETFQREVAESRPLLFSSGRLTLFPAARSLTAAIFLFPLLAWVVLREAVRTRDPLPVVVVGWATVLAVAALAQARFANSLSVPWSLLVGLASVHAWRRLVAGASGRPFRRASIGAGLLLGAAFAAAPLAWAHGPLLRDQLGGLTGRPPELTPREQRRLMLVDVARWLREHTEPTSGFLDPKARPEYGVLSSWTDGHVIVYEGRRPAAVSNFGDDLGDRNMALAEEFFRADEARASRILDALNLRYVIVELRRIRSLAELGPESVLPRLFFRDGAESDVAFRVSRGEVATRAQPTDALDRLRLVHESPPKPWSGTDRAGFKVYQHVAGAVLRGEADPGARIEARLGVRTARGRPFEFVSSASADDRGRFQLRFPYATGTRGPGVSTDEDVRLTSGDRAGSVRVQEKDVLDGRSVEAPSLSSSAGVL